MIIVLFHFLFLLFVNGNNSEDVIVLHDTELVLQCPANTGDLVHDVVTNSTNRWVLQKESTPPEIRVQHISLTESGIYLCKGKNYHVTVTYQPKHMEIAKNILVRLKNSIGSCKKSGIVDILTSRVHKKLCPSKNTPCPVQVRGSCNGRYMVKLQLYRKIPPTDEKPLAETVKNLNHYSLEKFKRYDEHRVDNDMETATNQSKEALTELINGNNAIVKYEILQNIVLAKCQYNGSRLASSMCLPCEPGSYNVIVGSYTPQTCIPCPDPITQPYYGASDCESKPRQTTEVPTNYPLIISMTCMTLSFVFVIMTFASLITSNIQGNTLSPTPSANKVLLSPSYQKDRQEYTGLPGINRERRVYEHLDLYSNQKLGHVNPNLGNFDQNLDYNDRELGHFHQNLDHLKREEIDDGGIVFDVKDSNQRLHNSKNSLQAPQTATNNVLLTDYVDNDRPKKERIYSLKNPNHSPSLK